MSWTRNCYTPNCSGSQKLVQMNCGITKKSKGNWWWCDTCGQEHPEFEIEMGDFASASGGDEYILVWVSGNPRTCTQKFSDLTTLNTFMHETLKSDSEEYPLHIVRRSDFAVVEVEDVPRLQRTAANRYQYCF